MTGAEPPGSFPDREAWELAAASPERKSNIALIGFSGTGKTSTGKILAAGLGYQFADTDALVERRTGLSIPAIFRCLGEGTFREAEKEVRNHPAALPCGLALGLPTGIARPDQRRFQASSGLQGCRGPGERTLGEEDSRLCPDRLSGSIERRRTGESYGKKDSE